MRLRILGGTLLLVVGLSAYALAVAGIVTRVLPDDTALDLAFYGVAGVAWILPAARLTRWMQQARPFRAPTAE